MLHAGERFLRLLQPDTLGCPGVGPLDSVADLIGSVDGLPANLSAGRYTR